MFEFSADSENDTNDDNDKFDSIVKMQSVLLRGKGNATASNNAEASPKNAKNIKKQLNKILSGPVRTIGEVSVETSLPDGAS